MVQKRKTKSLTTETGSVLTLLPMAKPRRIPLKTLAQVKNEMSYCYRAMVNGNLESSSATRAVYILGQIAKVIEVAELEKRLEFLEKTHEHKK